MSVGAGGLEGGRASGTDRSFQSTTILPSLHSSLSFSSDWHRFGSTKGARKESVIGPTEVSTLCKPMTDHERWAQG